METNVRDRTMYLDEVKRLLDRFRTIRILVLGDFMLDECLWGNISRISPEAPVPILAVTRRHRTLGGAGNVVKNLRSLGIQVSAIAVTGSDATGRAIGRELKRIRVDAQMVEEAHRASTQKTRLMSIEHGQQVFRFDRETDHPILPETEERVRDLLSDMARSAHAIMCSDYLKGSLTSSLLRSAVEAGRTCAIPVIMSPKGSDPNRYRGAEVLIHNQKELELLSGISINGESSFLKAAHKALALLESRSLLVTRSSKGMCLIQKTAAEIRERHIPCLSRTVYDVTGAGDTAASVFTAGIAAGADHETAALLANLAAGIVVGKRGTACLRPSEILKASREQFSGRLAAAVI